MLVRRLAMRAAGALVARRAVVSAAAAAARRAFVARAASTQTAASSGDMFCMQCEQTENGTGCTTVGVCGKTPECAALQDVTLQCVKDMARYLHTTGKSDTEMSRQLLKMTFATLTNVNFDSSRFVRFVSDIHAGASQMARAEGKTTEALFPTIAAAYSNAGSADKLRRFGEIACGVKTREALKGVEANSVSEMVTYGMKGLAAYAYHALQLGAESQNVYNFVNKAFGTLDDTRDGGALLGLALEVGKHNLEVMEMLDAAHTSTFGHPTPTSVRMTPVEGKAILVSGHDLHDLFAICKQTEGTGVNVYTHGEMLPAHGYPAFHQFKHLRGNYGSAWQNQKYEFFDFPGPIVMTTNCLIEPRGYGDRLYTHTVTGWPGCTHLEGDDYSAVIEHARAMTGFAADEVADAPVRSTTVGFGHETVLGIADKVLGHVAKGDIKHLFFIGGCDGSEGERNYFRQLAKETPKESIILTAGCGKYRVNGLKLGEVPNTGLPRVLDMGQCNDVYSALKVATSLAKALNVGVNDLPLSLAVSWFEQKAVAVLLSLLHLGVKNIYLGPNLPAFVTPNTLQLLVDSFGLKKIGNAHDDIRQMMPSLRN